MDVRRLAIALLVALAVSAAATYVVYKRLRAQAAANKSTNIKIVAATQAVQAGTALTSDNVGLFEWPANMALTGSFSKVEDVIGRSPIYPMSPKQPILERDLAVAGSGIGLTVKIPEGMRAVSVRSNEIVGVAGFLYPGSHVDVLLTYRPEGSPAPLTQVVLENVEVLTAGQRIDPDPQGKPETVSVVTVLLSTQDSQKLILAGSQGTIQFILRNGSDKRNAETKAVSLSELLTGKKPPEPRQVRVARVARPQVPEFYVVEIITGDKRREERFEQKQKLQ